MNHSGSDIETMPPPAPLMTAQKRWTMTAFGLSGAALLMLVPATRAESVTLGISLAAASLLLSLSAAVCAVVAMARREGAISFVALTVSLLAALPSIPWVMLGVLAFAVGD